MSPLFISFEGGEGSGKTTQAQRLHQRLTAAGTTAVLVKEPGTTELGEYLRSWLKRDLLYDRDKKSRKRKPRRGTPLAELLLFAAARAELVARVIEPTLRGGKSVVIADRYADSTRAYQGHGRRLPLDEVDAVNRLATGGIAPDLTFLLDCPPHRGLARAGSAQLKLGREQNEETLSSRVYMDGTQRFERESFEFHQRVRRGYLEMAKLEPGRWCVVDATRPVEEISEMIWDEIRERLASRGHEPAGELELSSPEALRR